MPESQILICQPVSSPGYVVPGSVRRKCSKCGADVWVAPSSLLILDDKPQMDIQCTTCVYAGISATATFAATTPAQWDEIEQAFKAEGN